MDKSTEEYAIWLLDIQYQHWLNMTDLRYKAEQRAYYDGMREMLEAVVTDGYQRPGYISRDDKGKHAIRR